MRNAALLVCCLLQSSCDIGCYGHAVVDRAAAGLTTTSKPLRCPDLKVRKPEGPPVADSDVLGGGAGSGYKAAYRYNIWASRYDATKDAWDSPVRIAPENAPTAWGARLAVNRGGDAVAVWLQHDGAEAGVWANRYDAGARRWECARSLAVVGSAYEINPEVAIDDAGNALAVWSANAGSARAIFASRYDAGKDTWSTPKNVTGQSGDSSSDDGSHSPAWHPQIALSGRGDGVAIWYDGSGTILGSRYGAGGT